jgi:uncharacterized cupin superfamily protein
MFVSVNGTAQSYGAEHEANPGERLPPAKDLAAVLGVNTNTVLRSLRLLRDEGLLEFRRGSHRRGTLSRCRSEARVAREDHPLIAAGGQDPPQTRDWEVRMRRLNFLQDEPWDQVDDETRVRWFGHPFGTDQLGASLIEYLPRAPDTPLHMHYGVEEMFFILSGTLTVRTPEGEEQLSPGDVVYFPEGPDGLHTFSNPTDEPVRLLGISAKRFPDVVAYPERGVAWVATRHPERPVPDGGDRGIIARFELAPSDEP